MQWNSPTHPVFQTTTGETGYVNRVFCIAKNYEEHAREMGGEVDRDAPFHFQKSFDSVAFGPTVRYPSQTSNLHHEVELVAILGSGGDRLSVTEAEQAIYGYAVGIDFTRRDRQAEAKDKGRPWEIGKSFDDAAVLGVVTPRSVSGVLTTGSIALTVNGIVRQHGDLSQMAYQTAELIAYLSGLQTMKAGDLIYTGTPAGVGSVDPGDVFYAEIDGLAPLEFRLVSG
jgi:fumarylpyruvate hydrolase